MHFRSAALLLVLVALSGVLHAQAVPLGMGGMTFRG